MRQQINLYQPVFYEQRTRLSARSAVSMLGIACVALSLWRIYGGHQLTLLSRKEQSVRSQLQRQTELAAAAGAAQAAHGSLVSLQAQAKQLATQLRERQHVLELLQGGSAAAAGGFADRLEALARRRVDGVWLDRIVLVGSAGVYSLAGYTSDPNLVPRYFQTLSMEPALRGTRFDEFRIGGPRGAGTDAVDAVDSVGSTDANGATHSITSQTAPHAVRFRASYVVSQDPRSRSTS
jgi:hypothetical protein